MVMQLKKSMEVAESATNDRLFAQEVDQAIFALLENNPAETSTYNAPMVDAVTYHLKSGGRRIRAKLAFETALSLKLNGKDAMAIAVAAELFHNASLIHDDIQDQDTLRRGLETVWCKFGKNTALCAGDFLLSTAYSSLASFSVQHITPRLIRLAHSRISNAIHGQCEDLAVRSKPMVSFAEYEKIAAAKSGALLSMPLELAFIAANQESWAATAKQAADFLAIGYQIIDDIADVQIDCAHNTRAHSLNAVLALQVDGHGPNAQNIAQTRAGEHLSSAIKIAETLPHGAGASLIAIAEKLRSHSQS